MSLGGQVCCLDVSKKDVDPNDIVLWTVKQAAAFLHISPRTLDDWILDGRFDVRDGLVYIGGRRMVRSRKLCEQVIATGGVAHRRGKPRIGKTANKTHGGPYSADS